MIYLILPGFEILDKPSSSTSNDKICSTNQVIKEESSQKVGRGFSGLLTRIRGPADSGQRRNSTCSTNKDKTCSNCRLLEDQIVTLTDDLNAVENELQCNKEVIKVLQAQLEQTIAERDALERLCRQVSQKNQSGGDSSHNLTGSTSNTDDLLSREKQLSQLEVQLKDARLHLHKYTEENAYLKEKQEKLLREKATLLEMLQVKDQTVISLTNEIFELEKDKNPLQSQVDQIRNAQHLQQRGNDQAELERLRDSVNAYQMQNDFLNKEIINLNSIKKRTEQRQQKLELQCYEWEAKCCQIQSKLLSLLKEINYNTELIEQRKQQDGGDEEKTDQEDQTILSNESIKLLVQRLLDENSLDIPVSWRPGNKKRSDSESVAKASESIERRVVTYDELGFLSKPPQESEFEELFGNLSSDVQSIEIAEETGQATASAVPSSLETDERELEMWKNSWNIFIASLQNTDIQSRSAELKNLLRTGVPQEYRAKIWKSCFNMLIAHKKPLRDPNYYNNLVASSQQHQLNPSVKQIELDLLRTLPNNRHFESLQSDGIGRLRRVLTAYSQRNPRVGYCQGMNRLAAVALLFLAEEDAFWCLVAIVEMIMPQDYYSQNLMGAHVDQYVLKELLQEKLPTLSQHFERYDIELSLFSWFLTCFIDNIPVSVFLRIWDVFLYEGSKVLFRYALAFLKYHETNLLSLHDSMALNQYLRVFGERTTDIKRLSTIAFVQLNPFPMGKIKQKRLHYKQIVSAELRKLDELRSCVSASEKSLDSQSD